MAGTAALVLLAAGCGGAGSLDAEALGQSADAVHSSAAEGALLAEDAATGETSGSFREAHAVALEEAVAQEADTLRASQASGSVKSRAAELARLADDVARLLDRLSAADPAEAGRLADELGQAATRAEELGNP